MGSRQGQIRRNVLPYINHLHFIHPFQPDGSVLLRRTSHPVNTGRQFPGTVGLDTDIFSDAVQRIHQCLIYPQPRLPACQNHRTARIFLHCGQNLFIGHLHPGFMTGIAKSTTEVTPRKTNEYSRCTRMEAFSLKAIEYLINLSHKPPYFLPTPVLLP